MISVVLPVFNEQQVLPQLLQAVEESLQTTGCLYEIIFVNDGSSDQSGQILDDLADLNSRVRVIHFAKNFGHQAAVQAGLLHTSGDAVVIMDSDMQDSPTAIVEFIEKWQAGYDVVYAVRTAAKRKFCQTLGISNISQNTQSDCQYSHSTRCRKLWFN